MGIGVEEARLEELRQVRVEQGGHDLLETLAAGWRRRVDRIHLCFCWQQSTTHVFELNYFFFAEKRE